MCIRDSNRIVGTLLDPTFTALLYLFLFIDIYQHQLRLPSNYRLLVLIITYTAICLTYSRATLLALAAASLYVSIKTKKVKVFLSTLIIIGLTILLLPQKAGEGANLYRTSTIRAKIENYQQAISVFRQHPLGIGFNAISYFKPDSSLSSHSRHGFDSSLLNILITTGPLGLVLFLKPSISFFQTQDIANRSKIVALLVHSLFANSLLYPFILFYLAVSSRYRN
jgi:phosphatidylglycerophosphate synthase